MEELKKLLSTPTFWVGTVLVSLAINLVTPLLQMLLSKGHGAVSERLRASSARKQAREHELIDKYTRSPTALAHAAERSLVRRTSALFGMLIALTLAAFALVSRGLGVEFGLSAGLMAASSILTFMTVKLLSHAIEIDRIVEIVRERIIEKELEGSDVSPTAPRVTKPPKFYGGGTSVPLPPSAGSKY